MSKQHDLSDEDRKLLEEIEQFLESEEKTALETDSLCGFCAHLSSTKPRGDADFQRSLENRLLKERHLLQQKRVTEKQSHNTDNEHHILENTLKKKQWTHWVKHKVQHIGGVTMPQTGKQKLSFAIIVMLVIMLNLGISIPSLRAQIINAFKKIFVGENTIVQQIDPKNIELPLKPNKMITPEMLNGNWFIQTEVGLLLGRLLTTSNLDQAQAMSTFRIKIPETLPEGYSLREIKLVVGGAFLFYSGPVHDIILSQQVVGSTKALVSAIVINKGDLQNSEDLRNTLVKEVESEGKNWAWTGHSLVWEEDSISFSIGGLDLSMDEAINIAESLR